MRKSKRRLEMGEEKWAEYQAEKRRLTHIASGLKLANCVKVTPASKTCYRCKLILDSSKFHKKKHSKDGLHHLCIECQRAYMKSNYHQSSGKLGIARTTRLQRKRRDWLDDYKSTLECLKCGENHPACLQFHHRDRSKKLFEVSLVREHSKKDTLEEIAKCDVLCANCHAKLHYEERMAT